MTNDITYPSWYGGPQPAPTASPPPRSPTYAEHQAQAQQAAAAAQARAALSAQTGAEVAPTGVGPTAGQSAAAGVNPFSSSVADAIAAAMQGSISPYIGIADPGYKVPQGYHSTDPRYQAGEIAPGTMRRPYETEYGAPIYTIDDINKYYARPGEVPRLQVQLYNHGFLKSISGVMDNATASALWDAYQIANKYGIPLEGPNGLYAMQDKNLSSLGLTVGPNGAVGGGSGAGPAVPAGPKTVINTQVNKSSRATAQALMIQALTTELGREPMPSEVDRFLHALNASEAAHPSVTTSHYDATGSLTGSSTVNSTFDAAAQQMEAVDYARQNAPVERRQYQGSQYFDTIARMLGM